MVLPRRTEEKLAFFQASSGSTDVVRPECRPAREGRSVPAELG